MDLFFAAEWRKSGSEGGEGFSRRIVYVSLHETTVMIELLAEPALVENALEAVGEKTEEWSDRWWWKPLRYLTLVGPFIAVGVYYHWFL